MPLVMIKSDPRSREKPCLRCGYSLRKITDSNHCPECGLSLWLSLNQNDTLEMSNPDWLRRMALALWIMAGANLIALIALCPLSLQVVRTTMFQQQRAHIIREAMVSGDPTVIAPKMRALRPHYLDETLINAAILAAAAAFVLSNVGMVLLSSEEGRYPDQLAGFRLGMRIVCGIAALAALLVCLAVVHQSTSPFAEWLTRLSAVAGAMLTWGYLRRLARRMPHKRLTRITSWMIATPLVSLIYAFIRRWDWPPDLLPLIYLLIAMPLFIWFAILLKRTAKLADSGWASETATTR
jgi:hypothetical protein